MSKTFLVFSIVVFVVWVILHIVTTNIPAQGAR